MARRLSTMATGLSLLLCVATFELWMRSYDHIDSFSWNDSTGHRQLSSERGGILLFKMRTGEFDHAVGFFTFTIINRPARLMGTRVFGFAFYRDRRGGFHEIPDWFLLVFFLLLPMRAFSRQLRLIARRRRMARGQCPQCGYDLRATSERCPECGRPIRPISSLLSP